MDWFESGLLKQRPMLKKYAMRLYRNVDAAEDAVQDTFCRAISYRDKFVEGTNLAAWLSTVMKNAFLASTRRGWSARVTLSDDPRYADHVPAVDNPERAMIVAEGYDTFECELPEAQKSTMMLLALGFSYRQVAEHERIPEGTVKSRAKRGRDRLAQMAGAI